jgi:hypothetical protein
MRKIYVIEYQMSKGPSLGTIAYETEVDAANAASSARPTLAWRIVAFIPLEDHLAAIDRAQEKINRAELSAMEASAASALS